MSDSERIGFLNGRPMTTPEVQERLCEIRRLMDDQKLRLTLGFKVDKDGNPIPQEKRTLLKARAIQKIDTLSDESRRLQAYIKSRRTGRNARIQGYRCALIAIAEAPTDENGKVDAGIIEIAQKALFPELYSDETPEVVAA